MAWAGFGRTQIRYDMFDLERSAGEAKRLDKCEAIYHRGQQVAWDGTEVLPMLLRKHGGIHIAPEKKEALKRLFAIIMWGELAAWKISAQLAEHLVPLEAKMAATSQAFDEARHFYVMHDYLSELGYVPTRLDRAPQALLDLVLDTPKLAHKLLGMQLMIETIALTVFQTVRELEIEPVLSELMKYYERDEARHVGLGMQYLPSMLASMTKRELGALMLFQARLMFWALWENKVLEDDFRTLGIDPRRLLERGRKKQLAALGKAFGALGLPPRRSMAVAGLNAATELLFPENASASNLDKVGAAWRALWAMPEIVSVDEFRVHETHDIQTVL